MIVSVFDRDIHQLALARDRGFNTDDNLCRLLAEESLFLVIGATGNMSLGEEEFKAISSSRCYLASASSDQEEIGIASVERLAKSKQTMPDVGSIYELDGRSIAVLAEGYPVNFWGAESVADKAIDIILAALFCGAVHLASLEEPLAPAIHTEMVDKINVEKNLVRTYYEVHT
jgi:S-adenosylhomocysteine hydrolase